MNESNATWPPIQISQVGATTIEMSIVLLSAIILFSAITLSIYFSIVRVWTQYASYEAAICLAAHTAMSTCRSDLVNRISPLLGPSSQRTPPQVQMSRTTSRAMIQIQIPLPGPFSIRERRQITLPVRSSQNARFKSFFRGNWK